MISRCDGGVGVLVNNAGVSYDHAEYFDQLDQTQINSMIQVRSLLRSLSSVRRLEQQPLSLFPLLLPARSTDPSTRRLRR